jgi:ribosomal protein S30
MPARKRYTTEQIVAKLREAEKPQVRGSTIQHVYQRRLISATERHAGPRRCLSADYSTAPPASDHYRPASQ